MISKKRLIVGEFFLTVTLMWCSVVSGADSTVPSVWNVAPMRDGAYREAFEGSTHTWATLVGYNAVTDVFPAMDGAGLPLRSNLWFDANSKVLQLDTDGGVVTNTLAYSGDASVMFSEKPVFLDLRIKFDAMSDAVGGGLTDNVKLALHLDADCKLVALHGGGATTNSTPIDTNKWHQLTVKLDNGKCDVLLNDQSIFSNLDLKDNGSSNTLSSVNFYGTGFVDELYVSHGDPAYAITGPTQAIPDLPVVGDNPPTDEQQTLINVWLQGKSGVSSLSMTQDQLSHAYLLNEIQVVEGTATAVGFDFGIKEFDLLSPTKLQVKVYLEMDNSVPKDGAINGRIKLHGKTNYTDLEWVAIEGAVTPSPADFATGYATFDFTIPENTYKFFKPMIVP